MVNISSDEDDDDKDNEVPEDCIFAEYTRVNRTKMKFKCEFKNAILHIGGHDYVIKTMHGEINY